ncbi:hypothetical protein AB4Y77_10985 [Paenarthrobacter sp. YAF11_1]|uniref:hypothetical protein n=1 Tax=Paenarthrobacter sp. YAF11_1 TaxID=3233074 RepID=UPI003F96A8E4
MLFKNIWGALRLRRIQAAVVSSLVLAGSLSFLDLPAAAASTDVAAPAVVSNYVPTATPLDVTNASARLTLKVRLSDETGVTNGFLVRVWNPETDQYYWLSNHSLVSGNLQNGVWQVTATVPQGAAAGRWIIQIFNLSDPLNNRSNGFIDLREVTIISA